MKLLKCVATNFGSYIDLSFDFSKLGLSLVYGPTGSGKSTLLDLPCWTLYGITSKDGSVDEIRSWQHKDEPTTSTLELEIKGKIIAVTRIRGKASENDLYWMECGNNITFRGKDIKETQALLNDRLGVPSDLYTAASYFHEFSSTSTFFVDTSKEKRGLFERIACLELPALLADRASDNRKETKKLIQEYQNVLAGLNGKKENALKQQKNALKDLSFWDEKQASIIEQLKYKSSKFEVEKATRIEAAETKAERFAENTAKQIKDIGDKVLKYQTKLKALSNEACETCGRSDSDSEKAMLQDRIKECRKAMERIADETNPFIESVYESRNLLNFYDAQIRAEMLILNPFILTLDRISDEIPELQGMISELEGAKLSLETRLSRLNQIYDMSFELRGRLLRAAIEEIEDSTNSLLTRYFDAEISVRFLIEDSDTFEVEIEKSGYTCAFTQLSKGQRGLLKLCFSVSVMKAAASRAGVHFSTLFFDESLDGLDTDLKVKAFSLFQSLELDHESILLIDHAPEFQNLFTKKFKAILISENTILEEDQEE